jgi:hypothetical protein
MEGRPREYINDSEPQNVPDTAYYIRLVGEGSLLAATAAQTANGETKIKKGGKD